MSFVTVPKLTFKSRVYFRVLSRNSQRGRLLSYDFSHNICIGLFHDKKCCNCINLFPCIFVGFICIGFSIKWWRFD